MRFGYFPAVILCLFLTVARGWDRLVHADFWAEDGAVFLSDALSYGAGSLGIPYGGYFHFLQRAILVAWLKLGPLELLPAAVCLTCYVIFALVVATPLREGYAWLLPSAALRLFVVIALCISPGLTEMAGNLCNLNWIFFLWLAFLGLRDPSYRLATWEILIAIVLVTTIGTAILLLPLFVTRIYVNWKAGSGFASGIPREAWVFGAILAMLPVLLYVREPSALPQERTLKEFSTTFLSFSLHTMVLQPWLGDFLTFRLGEPQWKFWEGIARLGAFAMLFWSVRRNLRDRRLVLILAFCVGVMAWPVVAWMARPGAFPHFQIPLRVEFWKSRYAYATGVAALLFWVTVLHIKPRQSWRTALTAGFLGLSVIWALPRIYLGAYGPDRLWLAIVPELRARLEERCGTPLYISIYPRDWALSFTPHGPEKCPERRTTSELSFY